MTFKKIITNKTLLLTVSAYSILGLFLFLFVPNQLNKIAVDQSIHRGETIIDTLGGTKAYYTDFIVKDLLEYNRLLKTMELTHPKIEFSTNHEKDLSLPYPSGLIDSLGNKLEANFVKIDLYSSYPFKSTNRKLTLNQRKTLRELIDSGNQANKKIYTKEFKVKNKQFVKVAKVNYMTSETCVNCHNAHPDRNWDFDWKLGDARGVLEVTMPVDESIGSTVLFTKQVLVGIIIIIMIISIIFFLFELFNKEKEDLRIQNKLTSEFNTTFNELSLENKQLEHSLNGVYKDFSKYVIYSKTDIFGEITEVSEAFCNISGYYEDELIGQPHNIIRHHDMSKHMFKEMWTDLKLNKVWSGEIKNKKKDGSFYWTEAFISPMFDKTGAKIGYISIRHDITKKKIIELERIANELKYANRRKSKRN